MEKVFAREDEFPLPIFFVSGDGIESVVDSSLSCEESGKVLIGVFSMTDSYQFRAGSGYWAIVGHLVLGWHS